MKKFIILILSVFYFFNVQAQRKITNFSMLGCEDYFTIKATKPCKDSSFLFYINPISLEKKGSGLIIKSKNIFEFKRIINKAKKKFIDYKKNNSDTIYTFVINESPNWNAYFILDEKYIDNSVRFKFKIKKVDDETRLYITNKEFLDAKYGDKVSKGFLFSFNSINEINEFIYKLNKNKVYEVYE